MAMWVWIPIAIAIVAVVVLAAMAARQRRSTALRRRFGPEYDRAVETRQDRRAAEAELRERERQRAELDIRPLPEDTRTRFRQEWQDVQELFVDQPSEAVATADRLVYRVMEARGYPMVNFDAQADLVSVDHPELVDNYRFAHDVCERARSGRVSTEELREALLRYRALFGELLGTETDSDGDAEARGEAEARGGAAAPVRQPTRTPSAGESDSEVSDEL